MDPFQDGGKMKVAVQIQVSTLRNKFLSKYFINSGGPLHFQCKEVACLA